MRIQGDVNTLMPFVCQPILFKLPVVWLYRNIQFACYLTNYKQLPANQRQLYNV